MRRGIGPLALALAMALMACGGSDDDETAPSGPPYEVGRVDLELVDESRPTPADETRDQPELDERRLPVMVLYPAESDKDFPLIVFAHGHSRSGTEYEQMLSSWVEAGYVVAAPTFPLSSGAEATADNVQSYADALHQPGDISFLIEELAKREDIPIESDAVGVVGHSLGAITTLGMRNHADTTDPNVAAYVSVAGMDFLFPKQDLIAESGTPLLLIHGGTDPTVPVGGSESVFESSPGPTWFLRYDEGGHDEVLDGDGQQAASTHDAILAFFDRELHGNDASWNAFASEVERSGLGTLEENP